ncbi:MAG: hypothetical protein GXP49_16805 [Deltaproteobacteria bacterium]|nr:hypothetical protein [Deltaproteobacteria bacterium]
MARIILALIPLAIALYVAIQTFRRAGPGISSPTHTVLSQCPRCGLYINGSSLRCPRCGLWLTKRLKLAANAFFSTLAAATMLGLFLYLLGFALLFSLYIALGAALAMLVVSFFKKIKQKL